MDNDLKVPSPSLVTDSALSIRLTVVCRMHGHFPLLFFFPELELTSLEAFRHYQLGDTPYSR